MLSCRLVRLEKQPKVAMRNPAIVPGFFMPTRAPTFRPGNRSPADKHREHDARRGSSTARGYGATWQRLRKLVLHEEPLCRTHDCGQLATDVDHIVALAKGGTNERHNLQALCHACHSRKTARVDRGKR